MIRTSPESKHLAPWDSPGQKYHEQKQRGLQEFSPSFSAQEKHAADLIAWKIWEGRRSNGLDNWLYGLSERYNFEPTVSVKIPWEEVSRELIIGLEWLVSKRWFDDDEINDPTCYHRIVWVVEYPLRWAAEKVVMVKPGPLLVWETRRRYFLKEDHAND